MPTRKKDLLEAYYKWKDRTIEFETDVVVRELDSGNRSDNESDEEDNERKFMPNFATV